ncbi:MAG: HEPN domain-containing protein, partial [archaeon]|nr:HEPN domain-containing protein [archaeon]
MMSSSWWMSCYKKRMSIIASYNTVFHAARALLFKDGIKEKSHWAVARYLEYEYVNKGKLDRKILLAI